MNDQRVDATERQPQYGDGRQPWDDIVEEGWAPEFAAGNVLKYLRRDKAREHSLASARWYWARLNEAVTAGLGPRRPREVQLVKLGLDRRLTDTERDLLEDAP
jgi:hypothetical protein